MLCPKHTSAGWTTDFRTGAHDAIHRATRILADIKHSVAIEAIRVLTHIGAPMTRAA